ncbi:MAG: putative monocarboxylate transporter mch1 [Vezdaea aestivalis]|nr:MAG: putative monocarboxylate transporter mch1 [Vezdaea aestivalis]
MSTTFRDRRAAKDDLSAEREGLLHQPPNPEDYGSIASTTESTGAMFEQRSRTCIQVIRYVSFASAIFNCLCAGSITAFSLYGHLFLTRLLYTQFEVNAISIAAELGMYLVVPLWGYLCDRFNPRFPSILAGGLFGLGYFLAAFCYRSGPPVKAGGHGWPFPVMVLAFFAIGSASSCMYLSALSTCAKNFGRGRHKGLALATPIAAFGLSGMWQSQIGIRLMYERNPDGSKGDVDVFKYFIFLGIMLFVAGCIGSVALRIINEEELIDEAVDELERSGLQDGDGSLHHSRDYGAMDGFDQGRADSQYGDENSLYADHIHSEEEKRKTWLLNLETRRFLKDPTMWLFAAGFFCSTGPGESFINNLGTVLQTLYPPPDHAPNSLSATQVSIVALGSTAARLVTGTMTDMLAPRPLPHHFSRSSTSCIPSPRRWRVSRIIFLLTFGLLMMLGCILLASGAAQRTPSLFSLVSVLIGAGYGAIFSLTPIICSVVWGVENFGTNWGIIAIMPAPGATLWGVIYSSVYERASQGLGRRDGICYGVECYRSTFWGMAASVALACVFWMLAWRGRGGWVRKGVLV